MMKNTLAIALLSALIATPAFAADAAKASAPKSTSAQKDKSKDCDCDAAHGHGGYGHGGAGMGYGGHGMGMGGMAPHAGMLAGLNLSKEQQSQITKLSDDFQHNNWTNQGLINDESAKLRDLYQADKRDADAIDKSYQKIFDIKRQMIRDYVELRNKIDAALTPEQQAKMKEMRHGHM
ncbi:MAG: Spy/CpxP family protein refolding chaperone [Gallionellaceae bacterium]|jgi:Spy/CpxP family protein refolding chaperone|nr:Spy/CpxP family protein refolding chaperone [Gallionellaceae bacterium]